MSLPLPATAPLPSSSSLSASSAASSRLQLTLTSAQVAARIAQMLAIASVAMLAIWRLAATLPASKTPLAIPHDLQGVKTLIVTLKAYSSTHFTHIFVLFVAVFLFKQAFGIPGSALLNILAGALYGYSAVPLTSLLAATGSTIGYFLSLHVIGPVVFGGLISRSKVISWRVTVEEHRENLIVYLISLRTLPLVPGWFVNLASPFVGIPPVPFFISTLIGLTPFNFICIQAATTLSTLNSMSEILNVWVVLQLVCITAVIALPVMFKKRLAALLRQVTDSKSSGAIRASQDRVALLNV
ncbi:hypothetical protein BC831DRAFT_485146 [Entophlyctis helioformis]|nr:hypothetical protein BC831DRAFT_485146 [Entophlyctis helioformis]